jgi:TrmH family RNA methyltransferase
MTRLSIAGGRALDVEEVKILAVHAFDVFESAAFFPALAPALRGTAFSCGITRRRGRRRKYGSLLPSELARTIGRMKVGRVALVFGNEEAGLSDSELGLCDAAAHIPSSPLFPSLNISHAVQIVAYEIFIALCGDGAGSFDPVSRENLDEVVEKMTSALGSLGFFKQVSPSDMTVFFRDILSRAMLEEREARRLYKVFEKVEGIARKMRE